MNKNPALLYISRLGSPESERKARFVLNDLAAHLGGKDLSDDVWGRLTHAWVIEYVQAMKARKLAPASMAAYLSMIRKVAEESWMAGLIDNDAYQRIKAVKPPRGQRVPRGRAIDQKETGKLLTSCASDDRMQGVRDAAMIAVLIAGGLRRSELVAIDYEDIVDREKALRVHGKGNKERLVYMPDEVWGMLMLWTRQVRGTTSGSIFVRIRKGGNLTQERLTDHAVRYILRQRCTAAGIDAISPHDLRRTLATWLLESSVDIATVQDILGHASIETTRMYDRRGEQRKKDASRKVVIKMPMA